MAGEDQLGALVDFLSRLKGETVAAEQPVALRSVQRAALAAWCRRQTPPVSLVGLVPGVAQTPAAMLSAAVPSAATPVTGGPLTGKPAGMPAAVPGVATAAGPATLAGIGIDIEDVGSMPDARDYRAHPFYADQFTDAEISHAAMTADAKASLCGTWAAKEAVIKAGLAGLYEGRLQGVEITWDGNGRPLYAGAWLSVSHTATTAVAICVATGAPAPAASSFTVAAAASVSPPAPRGRHVARIAAGVTAGMLVVGLLTAWQMS